MRTTPIRHLPVVLPACLAVAASTLADTIHVNGDCGNDSWTGLSSICVAPSGPKATIDAAVDAAVDGDVVLVADGVYTGAGNRNVALAGSLTILSANGPASCIIDCESAGRAFSLFGTEAVIEGLTITNGSALTGGAIWGEDTSVTVRDCIFTGNQAEVGGAIRIGGDSSPRIGIERCRFVGNHASPGGAGGLLAAADTVRVVGSVFIANTADAVGAMATLSGEVDIANTVFIQNDGGFIAGALATADGRTTIANCVFSRNEAAMGGAVEAGSHETNLINCTLSGNSPDSITAGSSHPISVFNTIAWGNTPDQIDTGVFGAFIEVRFSDIQGGWPGSGNIDADPIFVAPGVDDLRLGHGSPCLDVGDNDALPPDTLDLDGDGDTTEPLPIDLAGNPRIGNGVVDLGATEGAFDVEEPMASDNDIDQGDFSVLVPEGGLLNPPERSALVVSNATGPDDSSFLVRQFGWDLHPGAGGYRDLGAILATETTLDDGQLGVVAFIPFNLGDLDGADPLAVDLTCFDAATGAWILAVSANTTDSPGHAGPVGDRVVVVGSDGWGMTNDLGDYGVFWNPVLASGFAWALVDHSGDFAPGVPVSSCPGDCVTNGVVDTLDLLVLLQSWGTPTCDISGDGSVDALDIAQLLALWGPCPVPTQTPAPSWVPRDRRGNIVASDVIRALASWSD